jgi:tetratricopeptide (TPR) repeat protein
MNRVGEPGGQQATFGIPIEAEYAIEYPVIGDLRKTAMNPHSMDLYLKSLRNLQEGNEREATLAYAEALKVDPSFHEHAREALLSAIQNTNLEAAGAIYYWLGIHSQYLKDHVQAAAWYSLSIDALNKAGKYKEEGRAHCNLGTVKMELRDPAGMDEYQRAIELNPQDGIAHICKGIAYFLIDEYDKAMDSFAEAVYADPGRYSPIIIRKLQFFSYHVDKDLDEIGKRIAIKQGLNVDHLSTAERHNIAEANNLFESGYSLFQAGRYPEALEKFERGKFFTNKVPGNYFGICMTLMQMVESGAISSTMIPFYLHRAEENIDECLRIAPTNVDYINSKKVILEYKKKYQVD